MLIYILSKLEKFVPESKYQEDMLQIVILFELFTLDLWLCMSFIFDFTS